jgi:hypothetical protein
MAAQPEVVSAALAGELTRQQVFLVSGAAGANPGATAGLLATACNGSLGELVTEAAPVRATPTARATPQLAPPASCSGPAEPAPPGAQPRLL